jgi:hypothetical protein
VQALLDADAAALEQARAWPWPYYAALLTGVLLLLAGIRRQARRRRRRAAHERALADLAAQLPLGPDAACAAFEACCAAWAGSARTTAPDDFSHLAAAGVPEPLVGRARAIHAVLAAARYGGLPPAADEVMAVARQIVQALR